MSRKVVVTDFADKNIEEYRTIQDLLFHDVQKTLRLNCIRLRNERGLKRSTLAAAAGLSYQSLFDFEKGGKGKTTSIDFARHLAKGFDLPLEEFLSEALEGIETDPVPLTDIYTADLSNVYPYNLISELWFGNVSPGDVNLGGVIKALQSLDEFKQKIIDLHYRKGLSFMEIGNKTGKTKNQIDIALRSAARTLRHPRCSMLMRPVSYDDYDEAREENWYLRQLLKLYELKYQLNTDAAIEDIPIDVLDLSAHEYNGLRSAGIETISQLLTKTSTDLMTIRNFGNRSVVNIENKLRGYGLSLRRPLEE